jgi:DNA-3-methyladenine glycosylase I
VTRCFWVDLAKPHYVRYHDEEWGVPVHEDRMHFQMLTLEGAQAGLSWETVLRKRDAYREAFADFDPQKIARFTDLRVEKLLTNEGLIRNRLKIAGTVKNAQAFLKVQQDFGSFDEYVWRFVNGKVVDRRPRTRADVPATSPESDALSKDLKKRGFTFVGSTIMYAYLQACGLVNDHTMDCFRRKS